MIQQDMALTPPLARQNWAHGNIVKQSEMVVESRLSICS